MYEVAMIPFQKAFPFLSIQSKQTGAIYVAPKSVCEIFGIDWKGQQAKIIKDRPRWHYQTLSIVLPGDDQKREVGFIPDRKLHSWICSISPEKVKPAVREHLIAFQDECDDVLYQYWTKGFAVNPRHPVPVALDFAALLLPVTEQIQQSNRMLANLVHQMEQSQAMFQNICQRLDCLESRAGSNVEEECRRFSKVQELVEAMEKLYDLSEEDKRKHLTYLCQEYKIHLPQSILEAQEPVFQDLSEIAIELGLYSLSNKPHAAFAGALIRHLNLDREKYQKKFYFERNGHQGVTVKYSARVIPLLYEWLQQNNFPQALALPTAQDGKTRTFQIRYQQHPSR